jgi:radical SAM/Cys-rich protein
MNQVVEAQIITSFDRRIQKLLTKTKITVLQINLGRICNLACNHCHVEAGPKRTENLSSEIVQQIIELIDKFSQIETIDLTGGAPELHYGFKPLVEAGKKHQKEIIVRSNLTIFFESGYEALPEYFAENRLRVVASLPCYLEDNVDKQRGAGIYNSSIKALQKLNALGYGREPNLILDLVYNPPLPKNDKFILPPDQTQLEQDYKIYLQEKYAIEFNHLFTITNLPIGRTKDYLQRQGLDIAYLEFLASNYNPATLEHLMCRNQLSIDYLGNVYDCDFNQMENLPATTAGGKNLTVSKLLELGSIDVIDRIKTAPFCYGCTAGSGSSCGGALL